MQYAKKEYPEERNIFAITIDDLNSFKLDKVNSLEEGKLPAIAREKMHLFIPEIYKEIIGGNSKIIPISEGASRNKGWKTLNNALSEARTVPASAYYVDKGFFFADVKPKEIKSDKFTCECGSRVMCCDAALAMSEIVDPNNLVKADIITIGGNGFPKISFEIEEMPFIPLNRPSPSLGGEIPSCAAFCLGRSTLAVANIIERGSEVRLISCYSDDLRSGGDPGIRLKNLQGMVLESQFFQNDIERVIITLDGRGKAEKEECMLSDLTRSFRLGYERVLGELHDHNVIPIGLAESKLLTVPEPLASLAKLDTEVAKQVFALLPK